MALSTRAMELATQLGDKKTAVTALVELKGLFEAEGAKAGPFAVKILPAILSKLDDKDKNLVAAAVNAAKAAVGATSPYAVSLLMPPLLAGLGTKAKPAQKEACLHMIAGFAENAPAQLGQELIDIVGPVSDLMNDVKKEVAAAAAKTMEAICGCTGNKDIEPFIPVVIKANRDIKSVPECVEGLAGCVFVQNVEGPVLAVTTPVLQRGLNERNEEVKRKCCVIVDNMCKLVEEPKEVLPLMPRLQPLLAKVKESMSDPEARTIAERAYETLMKAANNGDGGALEARVDRSKVQLVFEEFVKGAEVDVLTYAVGLAASLVDSKNFDGAAWDSALAGFFQEEGWIQGIREKLAKATVDAGDEEEEDEEGVDLYHGSFSLAYGTLTLLRDTKLRLKKNKVYGLLGANNCGKTTLMRAIANEQVEGFPKRDELRTVFVEHEIEEREIGLHQEGGVEGCFCEGAEKTMLPGKKGHCWFCGEKWPCSQQAWPVMNVDLCGADWVVDTCNNVYEMEPKVKLDDVVKVMESLGFGNSKAGITDRAADVEGGVTTYSGGWKMKMQLCAAQMMDADILMLDEPTGHLDVKNIVMIKDWLRAFKGTIIATSHDSSFLNEMTTHMIDFQDRKLKVFKGELGKTLAMFVEKYPEKQSYFELRNDKVKFVFPAPGPLEGVKSKGRAILKMKDVTFTYPTKSTPTVFDINLSVCMLSRVAVIGANGAGKSTAIKLLVGESKADKGTVWKASGLRMAYVAQHAFHHLEKHLTKTPTEYIIWRFAGNDDAESIEFKNMEATDDEQKLRDVLWCLDPKRLEVRKCSTEQTKEGKADRALALPPPESLLNRRKNKMKKYEYQVKWELKPLDAATWVERDTLIAMGYIKIVQREDEKQAMESGMMSKSLTQPEVEKHLANFGVEAEAASHTHISALSGGQKVKVVIAAAMWQNPHILILDEPTNYLDRDGLGALTLAINDFGGGVIIISHNREFADRVSTQKWIMDKGRLREEGEVMGEDVALGGIDDGPDEMYDASGNKIDVKRQKAMSDKDKKKKIKELEKKLKDHKKKPCLEEEQMYEIMDEVEKLKSELA
jgi:elongation factor 3